MVRRDNFIVERELNDWSLIGLVDLKETAADLML